MVDWVIRAMIFVALAFILMGDLIPAWQSLFNVGVTVLIATPIIRIIAAAVQFTRQRDFLFLAFSLFILIVIGAGVIVHHR